MSTDVQLYNFHGNDVRVLVLDGQEPRFVAKNISDVMGYTHTPHMLRHINPLNNSVHKLDSNQRGNPNVKAINEAGLYEAILNSRRPEAQEFKRWVTSEVLPSIRKHGMYATPRTIEDMLADPDTMIQTLLKLKEERGLRIQAEKTVAVQRKQIEEDISVQGLHRHVYLTPGDRIRLGIRSVKICKQMGIEPKEEYRDVPTPNGINV